MNIIINGDMHLSKQMLVTGGKVLISVGGNPMKYFQGFYTEHVGVWVPLDVPFKYAEGSKSKIKLEHAHINWLDFESMIAFVVRDGKARYRRLKATTKDETISVLGYDSNEYRFGGKIYTAYEHYVASMVVT